MLTDYFTSPDLSDGVPEHDDRMSDLANSPGWTQLQRQLHWWVAGVVACQFALQEPMRSAMQAIEQNEAISFGQFVVTTVHVWGGMLILALTLYRLRLRRIRPVAVGGGRLSQGLALGVQLTHRLLLAVVMLMGVTGVAHWYLGIDIAARAHETGKWVLGVLIALHVIGAIHHRMSRRPRDPD